MHKVCRPAWDLPGLWSKLEGAPHEMKVGAQPGRGKGAMARHLKVASPVDAGAGADRREE